MKILQQRSGLLRSEREIGQEDDEESLDDEDNEGWNVSRPDEAEGQRLNSLVNMSKLSLGRVKQCICTEYSIVEINSVVEINSGTFCSSKVSTLLNRADYHTKQHLTVILLRRCKGISSGCMPTSYFGWRSTSVQIKDILF